METTVKIGDTIEWSFDEDSQYLFLAGKTFQAKVAIIDNIEQLYGVYATYGQDFIPFNQAKKVK